MAESGFSSASVPALLSSIGDDEMEPDLVVFARESPCQALNEVHVSAAAGKAAILVSVGAMLIDGL